MAKLSAKVFVRRAPGVSVERIDYPTFQREIPRHFHDEYQISLCSGGAGIYDFESRSRHAAATTLQVFAPGTVHAYRHQGNASTGAVYRTLYVSAEAMAALLADRCEPAGEIPSSVLARPALAARFVAAHDALLLDTAGLEGDEHLVELCAAILEGHDRLDSTAPRVGRERPGIRRVIDYLRAHSERNVRLDELAQVAGLSPWRTNRAFSRQVGLPPHAYLGQLRIARAKSLLARGRPIAEVALAAGFADQAHLTRCFKRTVGVTPGRYARGGKNVQEARAGRDHSDAGEPEHPLGLPPSPAKE